MRQTPRWARLLLWWLAPAGSADDVLGDLEEAHRGRRRRHGAVAATSSVMLAVGRLACIEPARPALRIAPTDALREA